MGTNILLGYNAGFNFTRHNYVRYPDGHPGYKVVINRIVGIHYALT